MKSKPPVSGFVPLRVYTAVVKETVAARERVLSVNTAVLPYCQYRASAVGTDHLSIECRQQCYWKRQCYWTTVTGENTG